MVRFKPGTQSEPKSFVLPANSASRSTTWLKGLFAPVDNSFVGYFRIGFGAILLWHVWTYFSADLIRPHYVEPQIHFTWYGFDWIRPWTAK